MKKLFFNAIALMVLVAPLLMATQCWGYPDGPPNPDLGCEIACVVWVNYVDENGAKVPFGTAGYPDTVSKCRCYRWVEFGSGESLEGHTSDHGWLPEVRIKGRLAHAYFLAAPARDGRKHPKISGELMTVYVFEADSSRYLYDSIEVELNYTTPDKASIDLIKINDEVKWDRSSFADGKVPEDIIIDYYLDKERLKEFM